jgi:putative colanic acid biosysnthesis UDP-glucose lipid carrier transferase
MTHPKSLLYGFLDFIALNIALYLTCYWAYNSFGIFQNNDFRLVFLLANFIWFASLLYSNRIYTQFEYKGFIDEIKGLVPNCFIHISLFYALFIVLFPRVDFSFGVFYGLLLLLLLSSRAFLKFAVSYKPLNYIIIGHCEALPMIEKALKESHRGETRNLGSFSDLKPSEGRYLGKIHQVGDFLKGNKVNMILYVSNATSPDMLKQLMNYAKHQFIEFKIIPIELDFLAESTKKIDLHHGVFLSAKDEFFTRMRNRILKRLFDIVFSSFVIIFILSWLLPIICFLIVLDSKGSPVFAQNRVGFRGKIFRCLKFRTMTVKENETVKQAIINDARVTKIGSFLRKSNLDEMLQFFNVFVGDMSVVGPRPHPISLDDEFKSATEVYILRGYAKPGITGWAQVNGWRGPTDTFSKIAGRTNCDLWYVHHQSLILDIKIIFLTLFGSKSWDNAY